MATKKLITNILFMMAAVGLVGLGTTAWAAKAEITIKAAHTVAVSNSQHTPFAKFKEVVEKKSNGRIAVEIFPNAVMGNDNEIAEKVQMGVIQMGHTSSSNITNIFPEWGVCELPYLLKDVHDNMRIFYENGKLGGPVTKVITANMLKKNMKLLWVSPVSFRAIGLNTKGFHLPEQLKGKKIRCTASAIEREVLSAFGANPVAMGFGEVYTSLQQGTIDAEGLPADLMYDSKHHEVLRSILENKYNTFLLPVSMNAGFYAKLPDWAKQIVDEASIEAVEYANQMWVKMLNEKSALMVKAGVEIRQPTPEEWKIWYDLTKPIVEKYTKKLGADWVKLVADRLAK